jgi:hypothetical protein
MGLVSRGIDPLSDIHHLETDFDRVEKTGNANNRGTQGAAGHHAPDSSPMDTSR